MTEQVVAGVDWAGGSWLAVTFHDGTYERCVLPESFDDLLEDLQNLDRMLIDIPIGLPDDEDSLADREALDSLARSVTGRSSSVFPVPSRGACRLAVDSADYETVAQANEDEVEKGLNYQSYYIAAACGEVDAFLRSNESEREVVVESHPEVCFRGLLGRQLEHSKGTAAGVGERLAALGNQLETPGKVVETICRDLPGESDNVAFDDVMDALVLAVTAGKTIDECHRLPEERKRDNEGLPIQMEYWSEEPLV